MHWNWRRPPETILQRQPAMAMAFRSSPQLSDSPHYKIRWWGHYFRALTRNASDRPLGAGLSWVCRTIASYLLIAEAGYRYLWARVVTSQLLSFIPGLVGVAGWNTFFSTDRNPHSSDVNSHKASPKSAYKNHAPDTTFNRPSKRSFIGMKPGAPTYQRYNSNVSRDAP